MASQLKRKKDDDDDGENVSRTGRQRKKSAKVLEMEAEAEELALVLRARVETPTTPRPRPTIPKGPRIKKTPAKAELTAATEDDLDDIDEEEEVSPTAVADAQSKSGRVRKKSAKLMEMVEAEELDRKIFRTSHIPKSFRTAVNPSPAMPAKKVKLKIPAATATSPVRSAESSASSPPGLSPSAIKLLLSSPSKKTPGGTSNPPEPILSMLGASLASPTKLVPQPKKEPTAGTILPEETELGALATAAALASPTKDQDFEVKFLQDCPDAVVNTKPVVKKRSKKQATPTPSAPALEKPAVISPGSSPKSMPKLKNLLSPVKKPPASNRADQPLLSKMMGEVGQIGPPPPSSAEAKNMKKLLGEVGRIGPPPPSSAEAKNMKKRARKEAAAALKNQTEGVLKKFSPTQIPTTVRHFAMPKATVSFGMPQLQPAMGLPMLSPFDDDSNNEEDDEQDQLMIDTTKVQKKKKVVKKEKLIKPKPVMVEQLPPELELVIPPRVEVEQEIGMLVEEVVGPPDEEDEDFDNELVDDDEDDDDGEDVDVEVPSYANTNFMATKVQTSTEKKASKDKKKKKGKKDDPEKQKKKRGPTAYMLWCNAHRAKLVKDNPGIDFATISRRLGEMWSGQTDKDKMTWKKKAKKLASKGSTIISTGKGVSQMVHGGSGATLLNKPAAHAKGGKVGGSTVSPQVSRAIAAATAAAQQQRIDQDQAPSPLRLLRECIMTTCPDTTMNLLPTELLRECIMTTCPDTTMNLLPTESSGCTPLDIAAHLKLLGESLSIIGARLQEHHGQIAVQGTLPVLLDSLLCALGPLACLTTNVPQLDGAPLQTHANTLDHIAYIMPGIG